MLIAPTSMSASQQNKVVENLRTLFRNAHVMRVN